MTGGPSLALLLLSHCFDSGYVSHCAGFCIVRADATGQPLDKIEEDTDRDFFMTVHLGCIYVLGCICACVYVCACVYACEHVCVPWHTMYSDRKCYREDIKRGEPDTATRGYANTH